MTDEPASTQRQDMTAGSASIARAHRRTSLRALHLLEYALAAPAPRRQRTWVHRVTNALDALARALGEQTQADEQSIGLLAEIALSHPRYALQVRQLRQELLDVAIAVASVREQIEPDPERGIDAADIRDKLASVTRRIRGYHAREADLVFDAIGIAMEDDPGLL